MFRGYIYCIENKVNGKKYIGQTRNKLESRFTDHINSLNKNKHNNCYLQRSWNKYKEENFNFILLKTFSSNELDKLAQELDFFEIQYINIYNSMQFNHGYNIRPGGNNSPLSEITKRKLSIANKGKTSSFKGKHHSIESKKKMSLARKGKKLSKEAKKSLNEKRRYDIKENHPFYSKKHSNKTKDKISIANSGENNYWYGKKHSNETKNKISTANKGRQKTELEKQKISKSLTGKKASKETREKMSKTRKGKKFSEESLQIRNEKTYQTKKMKYDIEKVFSIYLDAIGGGNINDISLKFNVPYSQAINIKSKKGIYSKIIDDFLKNDSIYNYLNIHQTIYYNLFNNEKINNLSLSKLNIELIINFYNFTLEYKNYDNEFIKSKLHIVDDKIIYRLKSKFQEKENIYLEVIREYNKIINLETKGANIK